MWYNNMFVVCLLILFFVSEAFREASYKNLHICPSMSTFKFTNWDSADQVGRNFSDFKLKVNGV